MICCFPARGSSLTVVMPQNYLCALLLVIFPVCLSAGQKQDPVLPTLLVKPVTGQVLRGEEVDIPVKVVPAYGGDVRVEISQPARFGSLVMVGRKSASTPVFRYNSNHDIKAAEDSFQIRVKSPGHAWNTYTAKIVINDPRGTLDAQPKNIDFGKIAVGTSARKSLRLSNRFGANVSGTLLASAPYSVSGSGVFSLEEGESKTFEVCFAPTEIRSDDSEVKVAPEIDNFPLISLKGEGVVPFLIESNSATLSDEHPKADFRITNIAATPLTLECFGDPALEYSPPMVIPAHGIGFISISMKQRELPVGSSRFFHPLVSSRSYSTPLEITALGPPGNVSIEPLNGSKIIPCTQGHPILLKGIIRNTSPVSHDVELAVIDHQDTPPRSVKKLSLPPSSGTPFELSWAPINTGLSTPSLQLLESGKVIAESSWNVSVELPPAIVPLPVPSVRVTTLKAQALAPISSQSRVATQDDKEMVAVWLPPRFHDGIIRSRLVLSWRYFGSQSAGFVIAEKKQHNSISDRTGELPDEQWIRIQGDPLPRDGCWELEIPMPLPGTHTYVVYPVGKGDKIISPLTVGITWKMFAWPALRLLLAAIFIVCLVKVIRRRCWVK